jgi:hypothetical protein
MVLAVRHSLSEPIWEKPTTQCLGAANAAADSTSRAAAASMRTLVHFFIEFLLKLLPLGVLLLSKKPL